MTTIYYYSGTGNSLWAAKVLAEQLPGASVMSMAHLRAKASKEDLDPSASSGQYTLDSDCIGLVFPVHVWGVPRAVLEFLQHAQIPRSAYVFAMAVNAGQVSRTLIQLRKCLSVRGLALHSGIGLVMPSNYIPWGGPGSHEHIQQRISLARRKIDAFSSIVIHRETQAVERGPLWQQWLFTALYRLSFNQVKGMDKKFWVDDRCNGCGLCVKLCPAGNMALASGRPRWQHRCEQCLACLQWCPAEALQYGPKTPSYPRYHHPEVKALDLVMNPALPLREDHHQNGQ